MPEQTTERRVAFLGTGYIADWHAQCIASVSGVKLVAVCDRILPKAQALANKYGVAKVYGSLEEMLAAEELDAVHILLPPNLHYSAAKTILEAGVNVLLEKPMCDRADDCDALVRLAAERGARLGVAHNFLFAPPYEQLRNDLRRGLLGRIDAVTITWNRPLPQTVFGPFDIWMLRDPRNIMSEVGSHSVAHLLDLMGAPERIDAQASNPVELPTGKTFYRRWLVNAYKDRAVAELRFSFVPGFSEYGIHVRGSLASGTVDFERNTYTLQQHRPLDPDFDSHAMAAGQAKSLIHQARRTLKRYIFSKLKIEKRGNPYGESIARAMDAFYAPVEDERVSGATGAKVIRICEAMAAAANLPETVPVAIAAQPERAKTPARILVLGGTGFLGKEVVRQLVASGESVRLLVRNAASVPPDVRAAVECRIGDVSNKQDLLQAMDGVECVIHLARANVKSWADYKEYEVEATRRVAECAMEAGVKRLVYTGTIGSYYAGARAGTITEATPLIPEKIKNFYGRAKAESEALLLQMHRAQGLPVVILRPGIVIGRGGSPFHWGVGTWWHEAVCQIWGKGENKLPFVLVQDVARGILASVSTPGVEGQSFNLIGDPCLSAQEYLDELDRCGGIRIQRHATPILRFYLLDMLKWVVKIAVRHPERQMPSYYDWEGRTQKAYFDCTAAKTALGWKPTTSREELVRLGIAEPLKEFTE
ncbi:MAG TPA: NAD-dependent epimerase/dehydratase family protein [Acidobacteriaceae bacterium]|nr:NAD-dependent epimerase/dehydratase family protein [Acidobacteriaceae bacterium]